MKTSTFLTVLSFMLLHPSSHAAEVCRQRDVDLIFLLDGSRSVRPKNFLLVKQYVKEFIDLFDDLGPESSQIGVVQFGSRVGPFGEIRLNEYTDKEELKEAVDDMKYMDSGTMTGEALKYLVNSALSPSHGSRLDQGIHTIVIIMTDGKSQDYFRGTVTKWQREAKKKGVEIFAIGIGKKANEQELLELASEPKLQHKYAVESFQAIEQLDLEISGQKICDEDECATPTHGCEQICENTEGSYVCSCYKGFTLQEDQRSCQRVRRNLNFTNITHTTAQVHWEIGGYNKGEIQDYILVFKRANGDGNEPIPHKFNSNTTTTLLTSLEPATTYNVSVAAFTADDITTPVKGQFTTLRLGQTRVTISNATLTTLTVTWTPAGGDGLTGYELVYEKLQNDELNGVHPTNRGRLQFEPVVHRSIVTGLEPATVYSVRVIPAYGVLEGGIGSDEGITEALIKPLVRIINTSLSTVAARWVNKGDYEVNNWTVEIYSAKSRNLVKTVIVPGNVLSTVFHKLNPATLYRVDVSGHVYELDRRFSTPTGKATKKTKLLIKPKVKVLNTTLTTLSFQWKKINIPADSWTVKIFPKKQKKQVKIQNKLGNQRSAIFLGLTPSTIYRIEVIGHVVQHGTTFNSLKGKQKARTKSLSAPPVETLNTTFSTLTVRWQDINTPVNAWIVKLFAPDSNEAEQVFEAKAAEHFKTFESLQQDTSYLIKVKGRVEESGTNLESPQGSTTGRTTTMVLDSPTLLCSRTNNPSQIDVFWGEANENIDNWIVTIGTEEDENIQKLKLSKEVSSYEFTPLLPGRPYVITVTGEILDGGSNFKTQTGITLCNTASLTAPPVEITKATYTSLSVKWKDINIPVDTWSIISFTDKEEIARVQQHPGDVHNTVISGLQEGTFYNIQVVGHVTIQNISVDSLPGSTRGKTKSLISIAGPLIECVEQTVSSLNIEWSDVTSNVISWTISVYPFGQEEIKQVFIQENGEKEKLISQLRPETKYNIQVIGTIQENDFTFDTEPGEASCRTSPLRGPEVNITHSSYSSLTAKWNDINAVVNTWIVKLHNIDGKLIQEISANASQHEMKFNGLLKDSQYSVEVLGYLIKENISSPAGTASGNTNDIAGPIIECAETGVTNITLEWYGANVAVDSWTITIKSHMDEKKEEEEEEKEESERIQEVILKSIKVNGNESEVVVRGLLPQSFYAFLIEGNVALENQNYTSTLEQTSCFTDSLTAPIVSISSRGITNLGVTWSNINTPVSTWAVKIKSSLELIDTVVIDGQQHETTFRNLFPDSPYWFEVTGHVSGQNSPSGFTMGTTGHIAQHHVFCGNSTVSTITVRWSTEDDTQTNFWNIKIYPTGLEELTKERNIENDANQYTFRHLQPGVSYVVTVTRNITDGETTSITPAVHDICTTKQPTAPDVKVTDATLSSLVVEWSRINVDVDEWNVEIARRGDTKPLLDVDVDGKQHTTRFSNLQPSTVYDIVVVGKINDGEEEPVVHSPPGTTNGTTGHIAQHQVLCGNSTVSTITVRWSTEDATQADSWNVKINPTGLEELAQEVTVKNIVSQYTFRRLQPGIIYDVIVIGNIIDGESNLTTPAVQDVCITESPIAPLVEVTDASLSSLTVKWTPINVKVDVWNVQITEAENVESLQSFNVNGSQLELLFTSLQPNTSYRIDVTGKIYDGEKYVVVVSPPGITFGTTDAISPHHVFCGKTTTSTVTVQWSSEEESQVESWKVTIYPRGFEELAQETVVESKVRHHMFQNLLPGTVYIVKVVGYIVDVKSKFFTPPMHDACTTNPLPPPQIDVIQRGITYLTASFEPPYDGSVDEYQAMCIPVVKDITSQTGYVNKSDFTVTCNDLEPATEYRIELKSVFREKHSEPIFTTNITLTPPPSGLTLLNPTTHTMLAEWQAPELEGIDHYYVSYNSDDDDEERRIVNGSQTSMLLTNLEPSTLYFVKVQAELNNVKSVPDDASESTLSEVIQIKIDDVGFTSLNVSWNPSSVPQVKSYYLEYFPSSSPDLKNELNLPTDLTQFSLSNLQTATPYTVSINAHYRTTSSETTEAFATTLALPPIGPISFKNVTETSFVAHWVPPVGLPRHDCYKVSYVANEEKLITVGNVNSNTLQIEKLTPTTSYNVTVEACYNDGLFSNPIFGKATTTNPAVCSCSTYLDSQAQMQSMLLQMMRKIDHLNQKIDQLTSSRRRSRRKRSHTRFV